MLKVARAGKAGLAIGAVTGAVGGGLVAIKKIRSASEDGAIHWNGRAALVVGSFAAGGAALGGTVGLAAGHYGDFLFAKDGRKGIKEAVDAAKEYATRNKLGEKETQRVIRVAETAAKDARYARLSAPGNNLIFNRGNLKLFEKNPLVARASDGIINSTAEEIGELVAAGKAKGATVEAKLLGEFAEAHPSMLLSHEVEMEKFIDVSKLDLSGLDMTKMVDLEDLVRSSDLRDWASLGPEFEGLRDQINKLKSDAVDLNALKTEVDGLKKSARSKLPKNLRAAVRDPESVKALGKEFEGLYDQINILKAGATVDLSKIDLKGLDASKLVPLQELALNPDAVDWKALPKEFKGLRKQLDALGRASMIDVSKLKTKGLDLSLLPGSLEDIARQKIHVNWDALPAEFGALRDQIEDAWGKKAVDLAVTAYGTSSDAEVRALANIIGEKQDVFLRVGHDKANGTHLAAQGTKLGTKAGKAALEKAQSYPDWLKQTLELASIPTKKS